MPTSEERREVAARLREIETGSCRCEDYLYALEWAIGCDFGKDYKGLNHRLIDLVEPEPERTCRNLSDDDDVFLCSECQNETHGFMVDDFGMTAGFGKVVSKCPNCGAKVVDK